MPKLLLTQSFTDTATCEANNLKTDYYDSKIHGLILKVLSSGKRNFYLRYQNNRGKWTERKLSNIDASVLKLSEARTLAQQYLSAIAMGQDPFTAKAELKQVPTLAAFVTDSYLPYIKGYKRSWGTDVSLLKNHIIPTFGAQYMDEITKRDIINFIGKHRATHAAGSTNRTVIMMRYIFNLAILYRSISTIYRINNELTQAQHAPNPQHYSSNSMWFCYQQCRYPP